MTMEAQDWIAIAAVAGAALYLGLRIARRVRGFFQSARGEGGECGGCGGDKASRSRGAAEIIKFRPGADGEDRFLRPPA